MTAASSRANAFPMPRAWPAPRAQPWLSSAAIFAKAARQMRHTEQIAERLGAQLIALAAQRCALLGSGVRASPRLEAADAAARAAS